MPSPHPRPIPSRHVRDRFVQYATTYLEQLEHGGDPSFGLATRVNDAGTALGFPQIFKTVEGTGANARSVYIGYNDFVGDEAGYFRVVGPDGAVVPLDAENRAMLIQTLRNAIAESQALPVEQSSPAKPKLRRAEANVKARDYLKDNPEATAREVAEGIGCSLGMVPKLPAWKAVYEQRVKGRQPKPRTVSLTTKLQRATGVEDESLKKLIAEQEADFEASPLEENVPDGRDAGAPRQARVYRKSRRS